MESLDVEGFGDLFQAQHPQDYTRIGFQNCGPQRKSRHAKKSQDGAMAVSSGKYDVMLVAEHDLYSPKVESSNGWYDRMCITMKGSYSRLSYNTNDGDSTAWNQYGGTSVTLTADMRSRMASKGSDPSKLGRWTWVRIEGKAGESTVFVSAYRPCKTLPVRIQFGTNTNVTTRTRGRLRSQASTLFFL